MVVSYLPMHDKLSVSRANKRFRQGIFSSKMCREGQEEPYSIQCYDWEQEGCFERFYRKRTPLICLHDSLEIRIDFQEKCE